MKTHYVDCACGDSSDCYCLPICHCWGDNVKRTTVKEAADCGNCRKLLGLENCRGLALDHRWAPSEFSSKVFCSKCGVQKKEPKNGN